MHRLRVIVLLKLINNLGKMLFLLSRQHI